MLSLGGVHDLLQHIQPADSDSKFRVASIIGGGDLINCLGVSVSELHLLLDSQLLLGCIESHQDSEAANQGCNCLAGIVLSPKSFSVRAKAEPKNLQLRDPHDHSGGKYSRDDQNCREVNTKRKKPQYRPY